MHTSTFFTEHHTLKRLRSRLPPDSYFSNPFKRFQVLTSAHEKDTNPNKRKFWTLHVHNKYTNKTLFLVPQDDGSLCHFKKIFHFYYSITSSDPLVEKKKKDK